MSWDPSCVPGGVLGSSIHGLPAGQATAMPMVGAADAGGAVAATGQPTAAAAGAGGSVHGLGALHNTGLNSHNHQQQPTLPDDLVSAVPLDPDIQTVKASASAAAAATGVSAGNAMAGQGSPGTDEQNGDGDSDHDENSMNQDDAEGIWSPDIEQSFQEALAIYPPCGRRKIILSDEGKMYGRNELIARYIKVRTGKVRTRKQVSSHIQVLARKKARELQSRLKEAQNDKELGVLNSIIQTLPGMSSAQIVSTHFDQDENNPGAAAAAAAAASGGAAAGSGNNGASATGTSGNHLPSAMASESYQRSDAAPQPSGGHAHLMPRTVGASSAAITTTGSNAVAVKNEPGPASVPSMSNTPAVAPAANANAVWPVSGVTSAMPRFNDPMAFTGSLGPSGMMAAAVGTPFVMAPQSMAGMQHMSLMPRAPLAMNHAVPVCNRFMLHEMSGFMENRKPDSSDSTTVPQHFFVHIPPDTNFLSPSLEDIEIRVISDKFPGLRDLYEKGPQDAFYLIKFWADINAPRSEDSQPYYGVSTTYRSPTSITCRCNTLICSFGQQVVEKVETQHSSVENGVHVVHLHRTPMCDYMVKFIHKLIKLSDRTQMNSVLENFTVLQLVVNKHTDELLLCLAFMFEVSLNNSNGTYHNIYRLVKE